MRTNNGKVRNLIISVYFVLIILAILMATLFSAFQDLSSNPLLSFLIVLTVFAVIILIVHFVAKYFEYDSDGVKVVVINRGLLLADHFNYREKQLIFAKDKLLSYKFDNFLFYKSLTLRVLNSEDRERIEKFNVTLVTRKKRKYIKQSLNKMIKKKIKSKIE